MAHFDYCCVIWGNCSAYLEDKLTKFQNKSCQINVGQRFKYPFCILFLWIKIDAFLRQGDISKSSTNVQNSPWYLRTPLTFTSEIHSRIVRYTCPLQLYSSKPIGTFCLFMYNIHPQLMSLKQDTLSGCNIRVYLSNSEFLFFRYFLMFSSCIVHCNTVHIYCVIMYVNCSTNSLSVYLVLYLVQCYCWRGPYDRLAL